MKNVHFSSSSNDKEARSSMEFHEPLNFLILVLLGVLRVRFRGFGISPLVEHDVIMLFFIVAIVIYGIAFLGMKLGPQNADYLYKFKFVCVICAILACDLLASILVDPTYIQSIQQICFVWRHKETRSRWWWSSCGYGLIGPFVCNSNVKFPIYDV